MDVSKIISISRKQTNTSTGQISDADYLDYLNIIYKEAFSRLSVNSKKYTRQSYSSTLVTNQSEYTYPLPATDDTGLKSVLNLYINYGDGEKEAKIYDSMISGLDEYDDRTAPIAIVRDNSLFFYPAPITAGTFRVEGKYIPIDLELTTTSSNIKLAAEYHDTLISGLNGYVFGEKQLFDKQGLQKQMFEEGIQRIKTEGAMEMESGYTVQEPDLSDLE